MYPLGHLTVASGTVWIGSRVLGNSADAANRIVNRIDYRLVLLGALLPDLIDKPIGYVIFRDYFDGNGHLYGHTLLAAIVVILPGVLLVVRWGDPRLVAVGIAMLCHLAVDPANHSLDLLLWPLLGTEFPEITLLGTRMTILTETISALMLLSAAIYLRRARKLVRFIREGYIS